MKTPIIIIAGPTACGKTSISIELAKKVSGEIISADSMQVYKYMDIGTAKVKETEMQGIKHYLIDEIMPDDEYSAAVFQKKAKEYIKIINDNGNIPILTGGTGFYINALVYDNNFMSTESEQTYRYELQELAETKGKEYLFNILKKIDPVSSYNIHPNNIKRVIRAIEFYKQTGKKLSEHNDTEKKKESPYNTAMFILNMGREKLYNRINERVDKMINDGLVSEVENLLKMGYSENLVSMQGLGYKEIVSYLNGNIILEEAVNILKRDTRRFAKRQLTWFKHQCTNGIWIDVDEFKSTDDLVDCLYNKCISLGII